MALIIRTESGDEVKLDALLTERGLQLTLTATPASLGSIQVSARLTVEEARRLAEALNLATGAL